MGRQNTGLSPAEWRVMECLWESSPRTGREAADYLAEKEGWTRSTTLTQLRRMTEKGFVGCDGAGEVRTYSPLIPREEAERRETDDFLRRVYRGSVSLMLSAMTRKRELSGEEIEELRAILREAEGGGSK